VQIRVLPVGEAHTEGAHAVAARLAEHGFRADVGEATETIGKRIRSSELEKIPFVVVYGDRESEDSLAVREARRRPVSGEPCGFRGAACYACLLKSRGGPVPHLPGHVLARGSTESIATRNRAAACSGFSVQSNTRRSKPNLVICL